MEKQLKVSCLMGNTKNLSSLEQDESCVTMICHQHSAVRTIDMGGGEVTAVFR